MTDRHRRLIARMQRTLQALQTTPIKEREPLVHSFMGDYDDFLAEECDYVISDILQVASS